MMTTNILIPQHRHIKPHRHKVELVYQLLSAVSKYPGFGITAYRMQYIAEVNIKQMSIYLPYMINNGLLWRTIDNRNKKVKPKVLYHLTKKGKIFLSLYDTMHKEDLLYGISYSRKIRNERTRLQQHETKEGGDSS